MAGAESPAWGTIPARAGEPRWAGTSRPFWGDYPRSRGGTSARGGKARGNWGLSPLARGNPRRNWPQSLLLGTIPARAGEPTLVVKSRPINRDYPRSRGGTGIRGHYGIHHTGLSPLARGNPSAARPQREHQGLSPLARGNRGGGAHGQHSVGTIPARAGEPDLMLGEYMARRDYPRSRGGT